MFALKLLQWRTGHPQTRTLPSIPPVTKWNVVPPSITMGSRAWWVRIKVGA
ncbi:hypothetical protein HYPGJ_31470 [Hyphomicrobium sp. GJ21]|nr:hypothetical protein HYPGJ_31470 [Hyphomicrobium sp. GJ21]